ILVPRPADGIRAPIVRPRPGYRHRPRQPLAAGSPADERPALSRVCAVVRQQPDRRLAYPVQGQGRGVRSSAHPAYELPRQRALRRGLARLPARMAPPLQATCAAEAAASGMIEQLIPAGAAVVEAFEDVPGERLFQGEEDLVANAV